MALHEAAKRKALEYFIDILSQAEPDVHTEDGSPVKSLLLVPGSLIMASLVQDIDALRGLYMGNYQNISEPELDRLAGNLLVDRPAGSRATTTLRVYLEEPSSFELRTFPYFSTDGGASFAPIQRYIFTPEDIVEKDGEIYVQVPIIATEFGRQGRVGQDTITNWRNIAAPVKKVTNPEPSRGGDGEATNQEFFQAIQRSHHDPTLNQSSGLSDFVITEYPNVTEIQVVHAGDARMYRDEVWKDTNDNPNLDRDGEPWADNREVVGLQYAHDFGPFYHSSAGTFSDSDIGKRVTFDFDDEGFRLIRQVLSDQKVVISGPPVDDNKTAQIWEDGPHVGNMSDVYVYFSALHVQSVTIDPRLDIEIVNPDTPSGKVFNSLSNIATDKLYIAPISPTTLSDIEGDGYLVLKEGTANKKRIPIADFKSDQHGDYIKFDDTYGVDLSEGDQEVIYPKSHFSVAPDGDIDTLPVLHVVDVQSLDPVSLTPEGALSQTGINFWSDPGWYMRTQDPSQLYSSKEEKTLIIDDGYGEPSSRPVDEIGYAHTVKDGQFGNSTPSWDGTVNRIQVDVAFDGFGFMDGREVHLHIADRKLQGPNDDVSGITGGVSSNGDTALVFTKNDFDARYFSNKGYRDQDFEITVYEDDGAGNLSNPKTYTAGSDPVALVGRNVMMLSGSFRSFSYYGLDINYTGQPSLHNYEPDMAGTIESVILATHQSPAHQPLLPDDQIDVLVDSDVANGSLVVVGSQNGLVKTNGQPVTDIRVEVPDESTEYEISPIRVAYATHPAIEDLQSQLDAGDVRDLCEDTLVRGMFPSLVDMTIEYEGGITPEEMQTRIIGLLEDSVRRTSDTDKVRLDLNNIIAAIDQEGLSDKLDVQPMVRVTNYLRDGSKEVRYLNPDETIKQKFAVKGSHSSGASKVVIQRLDDGPDPPGKGRLYLGGNDPSQKEVVPYSGVIESGTDELTFIARSDFTTTYAHDDYETVWVTRRDYEERLEFTDGAIEIPVHNRPYLRELVLTKLS